MRPLICARGVTKTYSTGARDVHALRHIDLDIASGELLSIMGPSGNGKTTLLNCLSGLDGVDAGHVLIDGDDIARMSDARRTRLRADRMGFVFQFFDLVPVFSALENVELPVLLSGVRQREATSRARRMLERVGLAGRADHWPSELSGGEQQRVAIARALVTEPDIVWADEPTGNLDSETAATVIGLLREINKAGQTLVVVTHDPEVGEVGDRIVEVHDGRVVGDTTLIELTEGTL